MQGDARIAEIGRHRGDNQSISLIGVPDDQHLNPSWSRPTEKGESHSSNQNRGDTPEANECPAFPAHNDKTERCWRPVACGARNGVRPPLFARLAGWVGSSVCSPDPVVNLRTDSGQQRDLDQPE